MRADRLVLLALLLQARGRMSARALAAELEVSVRTVYRDLAAVVPRDRGRPALADTGRGRTEPPSAAAGLRHGEQDAGTMRVVCPLGLVNKAGTWYLVASGAGREAAGDEAAGDEAAGSEAAGSEVAAVHRLAGFGGQVEVLAPAAVRARLVATARQLLDRYRAD